MRKRRGLGDCVRLTQTSYRHAIRETVVALQNGGTDQDMADAWGVSSGTVGNARNKNADLSGLPLLKLGENFGADGLNTVLALIGLKAVEQESVCLDVSAIPCEVAKTLPLLIELFADGECCTSDVRMLDQSGAIDCLGRVTDMLRQRREAMRLERVA